MEQHRFYMAETDMIVAEIATSPAGPLAHDHGALRSHRGRRHADGEMLPAGCR